MLASDLVLVIEDDDDIRDVMQEVLSAEGLRVETARDGVEALSKLDQAINVTTHAPASAVYGTGFTVAATGGLSGKPIVYGNDIQAAHDHNEIGPNSGGAC